MFSCAHPCALQALAVAMERQSLPGDVAGARVPFLAERKEASLSFRCRRQGRSVDGGGCAGRTVPAPNRAGGRCSSLQFTHTICMTTQLGRPGISGGPPNQAAESEKPNAPTIHYMYVL